MAATQPEVDLDRASLAEIYLHVSRVAPERYLFESWIRGEVWRAEQRMPESLATYVNERRFGANEDPDGERLRDATDRIRQKFLPEPLRVVAETSTTFPQALRDAWHEVRAGVTGPRVRFELCDPPLHYLPWEYLSLGGANNGGAGLRPARIIPPAAHFDAAEVQRQNPLRILYVSASPGPRSTAGSEQAEFQRFVDGLKQAKAGPIEVVDGLEQAKAGRIEIVGDPEQAKAGRIEIRRLLGADAHRLAEVLRDHTHWHPVLHYVGHGCQLAAGPLLVMESAQRTQFLSPAALGDLARAGGVRLLTLQTPSLNPNRQIAAFAGFAAQARTMGVPAILFSLRRDDKEIPDIARVYAGLVEGESLDEACALASRAAGEVGPALALSLYTTRPRVLGPQATQQTQVEDQGVVAADRIRREQSPLPGVDPGDAWGASGWLAGARVRCAARRAGEAPGAAPERRTGMRYEDLEWWIERKTQPDSPESAEAGERDVRRYVQHLAKAPGGRVVTENKPVNDRIKEILDPALVVKLENPKERVDSEGVTEFGDKLRKYLVDANEDIRAVYEDAYRAVGESDRKVRLTLVIAPNAPELHNYPWEYFHDEIYLALHPKWSLVRGMDLGERAGPKPPRPPR